jgi:hypothetical protein
LQGEIHPLLDISMEMFPMFFKNSLGYAEKHFIKFDSACEIYNVAENDVAWRLFISTLMENVGEWFYSLFPGIITS